MQITILNSGGMRARTLPADATQAKRAGVAVGDIQLAVKPIQHSRSVTLLEALPIIVNSEHGRELDRAIIAVSSRTGRLRLIRLSEEVGSHVDDLDTPESASTSGTAQEKK